MRTVPSLYLPAQRSRVSRSWALAAVLGLVVALGATAGPTAVASAPYAIIDNGTVQLGIHSEGHLNVPGGSPSSGTGTTTVGLRYLPTGAESTAPGCLCEGWGAADAATGVAGYANESSDGGAVNLNVISFASTSSTAVSVVTVGDAADPTLQVTHDYHPDARTPNLYQVTVTIENVSDAAVDLRYRRTMDWDVEPTAFDEFVTILGTDTAANVLDAGNNGFSTANPLGADGDWVAAPFLDNGPDDHGARFDFGFGMVDPGEEVEFFTYYGAAGTEDGADAAVSAVAAEVFSYGQPDTPNGPSEGTPNTFIFGFSGVGGEPVIPSDDTTPPTCRAGQRASGGFVAFIQDDGSGLEEIRITNQQNAMVTVESFTPGTTDPVRVDARRASTEQPQGEFWLHAEDMAGNVGSCTASGRIRFR